MVRYLPQSSAFNRFVLTTAQPASAGFVSAPDYGALVGFAGAAITTLRPAGMAQIGSDRYDVITEGEYIRAGEPLKVVRVEGRKIVVRKA
jgi:membrane-bound serine protease (ClpP class)